MGYLPDALDEIPSQDDFNLMPGLEELKFSFPEKNPKWQTMLLIGRDCMWAHENVRDFKPIGPDYPLVRRTNLGWVLIGKKPPFTGTKKNSKTHDQEDRSSSLADVPLEKSVLRIDTLQSNGTLNEKWTEPNRIELYDKEKQKYACDQCDASYGARLALRCHIFNVHKEE